MKYVLLTTCCQFWRSVLILMIRRPARRVWLRWRLRTGPGRDGGVGPENVCSTQAGRRALGLARVRACSRVAVQTRSRLCYPKSILNEISLGHAYRHLLVNLSKYKMVCS